MAKFLRVRMPDGDWDIPAEAVAKDRSAFYARKDTGTTSGEEYDRVYAEEMEYVLGPDGEDELTDWAANNMNWSDVKEFAVHVKPLAIDYEDGWVNAKKSVIEK